MYKSVKLPPQQISSSKKNKAWRKKMLDWADDRSFFNSSLVRNSVIHKKINYDLIIGKLHMEDLQLIVNPEGIKAGYIPDNIQHYPILNTKLELLKGEELARVFDYRVVITNPNAISEIENNKKQALLARLQEAIANTAQSEEEFNQELEKINDYFTYEWQDLKEIRANALLNHYSKEYNMPLMFNDGFMDALTVGEEIYQCDIINGEPTIQKLNPLKVRVFKSGYSNRIEDADIIIIEDYWSPGRIIDTFYEYLSKKDMDYIENGPDKNSEGVSDSMDNIDERYGFIHKSFFGEEGIDGGMFFDPSSSLAGGVSESLLPFDLEGNLRVLRMYWKSRRKIKKVKSYDPQTGEEIYNFYPETYVINEALGEEEQIYFINEAWEGTKIGENIYVNIRPRPIQYNRLHNPSRCHFGIVGSIYNINDSKPYSLVDRMKSYNYLYDVIHDRLNKLIAKNWGKIIKLDLAKVPKKWNIEKWLYFAKSNGIAVEDSFNEGNIGAATGKLAGALNNASSGVIDAEFGNSIQMLISLLEFIKMELAEISGVSKQREGQISNRETVGGVERATLQSSHITEWLFAKHEDVKRRAYECFLETAKIALQGRNKKFPYILPDSSMKIMNIDGDEFAEADYGLLVDNGKGAQELSQKLDMLAQAALQNQTLSFSTIMKLYNSSSLAEKQRLVQIDEQAIQQRQAEAQQQQLQQQQQIAEMQMQAQQAEMELKDQINIRDNETKILIATMQQEANASQDDGIQEPEYSQEARDKLMQEIKEFDAKLKLDREKFEFDKETKREELRLKEKQINKKSTTNK